MKKILPTLLLILPLSVNASDLCYLQAKKALSQLEDAQTLDPLENVQSSLVSVARELREGQRSPLIKEIKEKLGVPLIAKKESLFTTELEVAVKEFQKAQGLNPTGKLDPTTFVRLQPTPRGLVQKTLEEAMQECLNVWKAQRDFIKETDGEKYIVINVPSATLRAYSWNAKSFSSKLEMESKVIVGAPKTRTPLKAFSMVGLKFNPDWKPTYGILNRNMVKNGELNRKWIIEHELVPYKDGVAVSLDQIGPSNYHQYRWIQASGDNNALGELKFETSSDNNIYLHDTNERKYFAENFRAKSSGCIRVQEFKKLGKWAFEYGRDPIVRDEQGKFKRAPLEFFDNYFKKGPSSRVNLKKEIPVYFTYNLVEIQDSKPVLFADVYKRRLDLFEQRSWN